MPRQPLEPGTFGKIAEPRQTAPRKWETSCRFRKLDGETIRVIREGRNKTDARRQLDAALYQLMGVAAPTAKLKPHNMVGDAADRWIARVETEQRSTTHETYSRVLERHVRPGIGALRLGEAGPSALQYFMNGLREKGLAAETRRMVRTVLLGIFELATTDEAVRDNPAKKLSRIRGDARKAPRALTAQERADFLAKLDTLAATTTPILANNGRTYGHRGCDPDLPDLARFMLGTGVRIGECLGVRWGDFALADVVIADGQEQIPVVNVTGNVVRVKGVGLVRHEGKTETARRVIPLPQFVVETLSARRPTDAPDDRPVFCAGTLGYKDPRNTSRWLRQAREEIGYPWVVSHVFRKTAASEWRRMGLDSTVVADLMGHAQVSLTQDVYFGRKQLHAASVGAMDAAWSG